MSALLDILSGALTVADTPAAFIRGLAAGDPGRAFGGIFDPSRRVHGREVLETWGALGPNQEGFDFGDLAGFGVDVLSGFAGMAPIGMAARGLGSMARPAAQAARTATASPLEEALASAAPARQPLAMTLKGDDLTLHLWNKQRAANGLPPISSLDEMTGMASAAPAPVAPPAAPIVRAAPPPTAPGPMPPTTSPAFYDWTRAQQAALSALPVADEAALGQRIVAALAAQKQANRFQRLNVQQLYEQFGQGIPRENFQGALLRMAEGGQLRLGPYTQALSTLDEAAHPFLIPRMGEFGYFAELP